MTYTTQADRVAAQLGPSPEFVLTEPRAAWLAALIDGEGCVGIWRQRDPKRKGGYKYRPAVQITNTNFDLVARVREFVDGYVTIDQHPRKIVPRHKVLYRVVVNRRAIPKLLEQVRGWLVIKGKQADLVQRYCKISTEFALHSTDHELFEQLYLECKSLNKRGA